MRGYDREEDEYYDEYEEEGEEQVEEEEYEERKPTAEEMEYLELRERIKEQIRKKMQKEHGSVLSKSQEKKKKLPSDNYGSFFGPSQPVIAQRVIQESKSLLENQHLALRVSNSQHANKRSSSSTATGSKNGGHRHVPKLKNELKTKVQKLKDTRDYSFLLTDDAELPAPTKEPAYQSFSALNSEAGSAQVQQKSKQPSSNSGRNIHGSHEERKPVFRNGQMHSKVGLQKPTSANKPDATLMNSKRQLGSNNGTGPGRPAGSKCLPSKTPVSIMQKKAMAPSAKKILPAVHKPLPSKPSVPKQQWEQRKGSQEPNKAKMIPKQPLASPKPQINKPVKQVSSHVLLPDNCLKKKPVRPFPDECSDDDVDAFEMLRKMIGNKHHGNYDDDDDDSNMEANFDDIVRKRREG
ncbi:hypothetical protein BDE02_05G126100 [Populus trichocarpa]|nr:hypothetical protein BDE02_05G126100 [Populus trichocarpa]KAI5588893.1 hypothetical protein BDE02_05G126100 [Populus trichocarpa]KAI5588899.1 hypothetical protein BDE02_05G126100 [Populus trichocarpa]KAI5588903.1 hypothetical protein BDE02_05G126100 [Populus trichocarpa]KAI5588904.1 hypothetical protein BDE02_05G126100 [Populus trichocarpa]